MINCDLTENYKLKICNLWYSVIMLILFYLFILGLFLGSFFNVLSDRLPQEQSILGRSHCDFCKKNLTVLDLIPVYSFLSLKGRCRYCHKKLSYFYPLVEILTGCLFVIAWITTPIVIPTAVNLLAARIITIGLFSVLLTIFMADVKYHLIPDSLQFVFLVLALCYHLVQAASWLMLGSFIVSGILVMLPILILYLITRGRGMGFGDVKLAFVIGFLLGTIPGWIALYIGFIAGSVVGVALLITKKKKLKSQIAFGPFLIIGIVLSVFYQTEIIRVWQSFFIY